jgi:hypothetical protein
VLDADVLQDGEQIWVPIAGILPIERPHETSSFGF